MRCCTGKVAEGAAQTRSEGDDEEPVDDLEKPVSREDLQLDFTGGSQFKVRVAVDPRNSPLQRFPLQANEESQNDRQEHEDDSQQHRRKNTFDDAKSSAEIMSHRDIICLKTVIVTHLGILHNHANHEAF